MTLFPLRPQRVESRAIETIPLVSNHYWARFEPTSKIFIYSVVLDPLFGTDARAKRQNLFLSENVYKALEPEIGHYVSSGAAIFGARNPSFQESLSFPTQYQNQKVTITITLRKSFQLSTIYSEDKRAASAGFKFFNLLIKNIFRSLQFLEFGRSAKYFNLDKSAAIADTNLRIFHGYLTSICHYESGIYLKIDVTQKILRTDTVLNRIDEIYTRYQKSSREEKRLKVKEDLLGKSVLAMYGNHRYWRIDDIIFDQDCSSFGFEDDHKKRGDLPLFEEAKKKNSGDDDGTVTTRKNHITLAKYYLDRYNLKVTKIKQPLILHRQSKTNMIFYLIPEFCVMTGIPDDIDDFTRKKITDLCVKKPQERMKDIHHIFETMLDPNANQRKRKMEAVEEQQYQQQEPNSLAALKLLGIEFQSGPVLLDGKKLSIPSLLLKDGRTADTRGGRANFQINQKIYEDAVYDDDYEVAWAIICSRDFRCDHLIEQINSISRELGVRSFQQHPSIFDYGSVNTNKYEDGKKATALIESLLEDRIAGKFDIVIIILPNHLKSYYKVLKQKCYLSLGILSQIVLAKTLERKGFYQVCSKILQQIATKVGAKLWVAKPPQGLSPHTMLIGIDSSTDKRDKNRTAIAFCATVDSTFSRYFNKVVYQKKSEQIIGSLKALMKDVIRTYEQRNDKHRPEHIIYFRDGVSESVAQEMLTTEVTGIQEAFTELYSEKDDEGAGPEASIKLTVVVIDKKISQRFFTASAPTVGTHQHQQHQLDNPPTGTLIDSTIVSKTYDFYLISQSVSQGTVTPTHYKVIYDNSNLPADVLQQLVYSQCFAYMNWNGGIKVPAPCQYARKLALLVSQYLNEEPLNPLSTHLYYL